MGKDQGRPLGMSERIWAVFFTAALAIPSAALAVDSSSFVAATQSPAVMANFVALCST